MERQMAHKRMNGAKKKRKVRSWSKQDHRDLKQHSKAKTPVAKISKAMKRSAGALRQQALKLGISLGHRR
jgi:NADH:ubiquinone oxidoreductase subunit